VSGRGQPPCLTGEQRAAIATMVRRRRELTAAKLKLRRERSQLYQQIRKLTAELDGIPLLKDLAKVYGVSALTVTNAADHQYRNTNPLDARKLREEARP
jgi:hypothetical protein